MLGLAAPGIGLWPLAWVGLVPAFLWIRSTTGLKQAWLGGFLFGAGYHYIYFSWCLGLHPVTWLGFNPWQSVLVALATWSLAALWGAVMTGLVFAVIHLLSRKLPAPLVSILVPCVWLAGVALWRHTDFGIPWALLEYTQVPAPGALALASIIGGSGLAGLIVFQNWTLAQLLSSPVSSWRPGWRTLSPLLVPLLVIGSALWQPSPNRRFPAPVAVVQGNLHIGVIRSSALTAQVAEKVYIQPLETMPLSPGTLVALPEEGAAPGWVSLDTPLEHPQMQRIADIARRRKIGVLLGVSAQNPKDGAGYNALALVSPQGSVRFYLKRALVPFGEYVPYIPAEWMSNLLAMFGVAYDAGFQRGQSPKPLQFKNSTGDVVNVGGLVCLELIYPEFSSKYRQLGADLLVTSANLGWFQQWAGGNPWVEEQFIAMGRMRAAENHLPLVIAANAGVSAFISGDGSVLARTRSGQMAFLTSRLTPTGDLEILSHK